MAKADSQIRWDAMAYGVVYVAGSQGLRRVSLEEEMTEAPQASYYPSMFLKCHRKECQAIVSVKHAQASSEDGKTCTSCGHKSLAEIKQPGPRAAGSCS